MLHESIGHPFSLSGRAPVPTNSLNLPVDYPLKSHDDDVLGQHPPVAQAIQQRLDGNADLIFGIHHTPRTMDMRSGSMDSRE